MRGAGEDTHAGQAGAGEEASVDSPRADRRGPRIPWAESGAVVRGTGLNEHWSLAATALRRAVATYWARRQARRSRSAVVGVALEHRFQHRLQGRRICRDDLPEDGVVEAKVFMTDTISHALDLRPGLSWEFGEPLVRNAAH